MDVSPALIQPDFRLNNPKLRYQLDPGEPGLLRAAKASDSMAAVSAQERGNLNQFRREAFQSGRMVIHQSITFTRGIDGLFNSLRAGLTEVVSVPMPTNDIPEIPPAPEVSIEPVGIPVADHVAEEIEDKQIELLSRLAALRNDIESIRAEVGNSEDKLLAELKELSGGELDSSSMPAVDGGAFEEPDDLNPLSLEIASVDDIENGEVSIGLGSKPVEFEIELEVPGEEQLIRREIEIEEVAKMLHELEMLRLSSNIEQLNEMVSGAIQENLDLLTNLVAVANHVGPDTHINDLASKIPILGVILDTAV